MPTNQIMAFATGANALVLTPDQYAALAARVNGFVAGPADEYQLNTVWRQSSFVAAMIGQFIADRAQVNVLDNGDIATLENNFVNAIAAVASGQVPNLPASSYWHSGIDTSGAAQSLIADVAPSITTYAEGNAYQIRTAFTATGATTADFDGAGVRNVLRADGSPIQAGDWNQGEMIILLDDGTNLRLYGQKASNQPPRNSISYQSAGTYAFTVPDGVFFIRGTVVGGGGGASGGLAGGATTAGGGGGAGGTAIGWISVQPKQVVTVVVGAGGSGRQYQVPGSPGGTSSIGAWLQATGGFGATNSTGTAGGGGGNGSGSACKTAIIGGNGGDGNFYTANSPGGGGGQSSLGGGGRTATFFNAGTSNGQAPGSGGGGLYGNGGAGPGGNGADGSVTIEW